MTSAWVGCETSFSRALFVRFLPFELDPLLEKASNALFIVKMVKDGFNYVL